MGDFEEKLESILNNPQAMQQIMAIAQTFTGVQQNAPKENPAQISASDLQLDPQMLSGITAMLGQYNRDDDQRIALLNALRPFVKEKRYTKIDRAIQIAKLSRLARTALEFVRTTEENSNV